MGAARAVFEAGTLRQRVEAVSARALAEGALLPIPTGCEFVEERGVRFLVRVLTNLARKDADRKARAGAAAAGTPVNPFLPYEPRLFVADVSESHVAILNKFNVVERHLLVVTREFEDQRSLLGPRDFEAWWRCLGEYESLGFYNGGVEAGASQPHKHLQLVPLPLAPEGPPVPIEPLLAGAAGRSGVGAVPGLDFLHSFAPLDGALDPRAAGRAACARYEAMLDEVGLLPRGGGTPRLQRGPYCLLATRRWMLLVPRSREFFGRISVNSLGFAGALLVRDEEQLRELRSTGPFEALRQTALPARGAP